MQKVTVATQQRTFKPLIKKVAKATLKPVAVFGLFIINVYEVIDRQFFLEEDTAFDRLCFYGCNIFMWAVFLYTMAMIY